MGVSIETMVTKLKIYEGILMRLCEYLGINVYDQTIDSRISSKAVLNDRFVRFLEENRDFFKRYHDDYYRSKSPEVIAQTINRKTQEVEEFLMVEFPDFFNQGKFIQEKENKLKYFSSYEIDFKLGNQKRINTNMLGVAAWHLGLKQQMVIENLNQHLYAKLG